MRCLRGQLIAAVTALALLLPGTAFARAHFFCRMMNRVVATCCCERDAAPSSEALCAVKIRMSDCCERLAPSARTPTLKAFGTDVFVPPAAIVATVPALDYVLGPSIGARMLPAQARAPPIVGPPLFIAHCSFLS